MIKEFFVQTEKRYELKDISQTIENIVQESGLAEGLVLIFVPHSTCGIIVTENEEGLKKDWLNFLKKMVAGFDFYHNQIDDNADSHLLAGLVSQVKVFPVKKGKILRGTWQQILLAEFDGPRKRKIVVLTK